MAAVVEAAAPNPASRDPASSPAPPQLPTQSSSERVSTQRHLENYFHTYTDEEAGTTELVKALRARLERRINGSVLANLDEKGDVFVSFSEKDRSASSEFWREICEPLKTFLKNTPSLARQHLPATLKQEGGSCMFQVQWLTGRKANYWHQDVRWKQHWDAVFFLYAGDNPTPTDIACPSTQPDACVTPKEYVRCADGQPDIANAARNGTAITYRPAVNRGDVVVCDNRRAWHRTPPSLDDACADDDALMTVRLKHFPPR